MTTALDIISDALSELGVLGSGQTPSSADATLCLRKLNQVLQTWSTQRLMVPYLAELSITLTGAASYTIGPTGGTVAARPIRVESAKATDAAGTDYEVYVYPRDLFDSIAVKDVDGGPPTFVFYDKTIPNGTVYVYPRATGYTLKLDCLTLLTSFAGTSTSFTLPEGYERALYLSLADEAAAAFGRTLSPDQRRRHAAAVKAIQRVNAEPLLLSIDGESDQQFQIERGY